jgi:hypothetical protein
MGATNKPMPIAKYAGPSHGEVQLTADDGSKAKNNKRRVRAAPTKNPTKPKKIEKKRFKT